MAGLKNGKLAAPPKSPNCVSSQADPSDAEHHIAPLSFDGDVAKAKAKLLAIVGSMPRTAVQTEDEAYVHVTFTTRVFRWVDDVEFLFDADAGLVHVRSASRTGYSDMGVNRKRVEAIRQVFVG